MGGWIENGIRHSRFEGNFFNTIESESLPREFNIVVNVRTFPDELVGSHDERRYVEGREATGNSVSQCRNPDSQP